MTVRARRRRRRSGASVAAPLSISLTVAHCTGSAAAMLDAGPKCPRRALAAGERDDGGAEAIEVDRLAHVRIESARRLGGKRPLVAGDGEAGNAADGFRLVPEPRDEVETVPVGQPHITHDGVRAGHEQLPLGLLDGARGENAGA